MDRAELKTYIEKKLITEVKHPTEDLYIYNYTPKCQFERSWDNITVMCRGLILDGKGNIMARPFKKFFNYGEYELDVIPKLPYVITEKLDGSLGILYWRKEVPFLATRGRFESPQAIAGSTFLHEKHEDAFSKLNRDVTYLFEIIYPGNRNVIDYKDIEDIFLVGMINRRTGEDYDIYEYGGKLGFQLPEKYVGYGDIDFSEMSKLNLLNKEGFVINFQVNKLNTFRMKLKFSDYLLAFQTSQHLTTKSIWETMRDEVDIKDALEMLPEEFQLRVNTLMLKMQTRYNEEEHKLIEWYKHLYEQTFGKGMDRKEFSKRAYTDRNLSKVKSVMFAMLDDKPYSRIIWNILQEEILSWPL
jgi:hypothetical protein